ncbi:unnamed protein product [Cyclocybe aegerita]|uniref:Uncharacterized protein n=1 Tax=Cyclocybe aegerita TaxID=1973307 RepID=A0A8S0XR61_CYCAE|nr:unnamed protein product [Cyclocybe aegerita]
MIRVNTAKADSNLAAAVLLGAATLMLLFTCISSPVVASMRTYRLSYWQTGAVRYVDVGLWGYCVEPIRLLGYSSFTFDANVVEGCSKTRVRFSLDSIVAAALDAPGLDGLYSRAHTGLLVLYPIVTALSAFSCVLQSTIHLSNRTRSMQIGVSARGVTWIFCYNAFTTLLVLVAFLVQISVIATAKVRVNNIRRTDSSLSFYWGNTIWLTVVAIVCHLIDLGVLYSMRKALLQQERDHAAEQAIKKAQKQKKIKSPKASPKRLNEEEQESRREEENPSRPHPISHVLSPPPAYELDGYVESRTTNNATSMRDGS